jgi:hypothetical protein
MVSRIATSLLMSLLALAAGLLAPAPALAVGAFGPPVTVIDPHCPEAFVHADAAGGADGKVYGFARFTGHGCATSSNLWYFEGSGSSWTSTITPYKGRILGVARGTSETYLLYSDGQNVRITKRTGTTFSPGRAIGGIPGGGDVIATNRGWWAVWREGGRHLKQAQTGGQSRPVNLDVGDEGKSHHSYLVSLAPRPGGGAVVIAECCGAPGIFDPWPWFGASALRVGVSTGGSWSQRFQIDRNDRFKGPQAASSRQITWLAWTRDRQVQATQNRTGSFAEHTFGVEGSYPKLAASDGHGFLAWDAYDSPPRVAFAEQAPDGTWTEAPASQVSANPQRLAAIAATDGKATVLMMSPTRLYARTQS